MRRGRRDRDLDAEIQSHLDMAAQDRIARGESPEQAAAAARREFGNELLIKEVTRQVTGWPWLERLGQDTRYGLRILARNPAFAATAILCLAIGTGATTAAFSIADALLLRPLPVARPAEVVSLIQTSPEKSSAGLSYPELADVRRQAVPEAAGYRLALMSVARDGTEAPRMKMGISVTDGFFQILGVQPRLGRPFAGGEYAVAGRANVVLLAHEFWVSGFGADPGVAGRTVRINGRPVVILGVLPEAFSIHPNLRPAYYVPYAFNHRLDDRNARDLTVKARLRRGTAIADAQAALSALSHRLEREYPASNRFHRFHVQTELESRAVQSPHLVVLVALLSVLAAFVLAIAAANVASLLLARASARSREIAIRQAIGAGRARLLRQLLTESIVLSALGAAVGVLLALIAIRFLSAIQVPTDTPIVLGVRLDARVLLFASAAAIATALMSGIVPAWRSLGVPAASALMRAAGASSTRGGLLARNTLVVLQVALSLALLVASAALLDAFRLMLAADPGVRTSNLLMMEFDPSMAGRNLEQCRGFYRQILDRTSALPGVRSVSLARAIPFRPNFTEEAVAPAGYVFPRGQESAIVSFNIVEAGYFETFGVQLTRGRPFTANERSPVAIVNEEFARRYWPGQSPLGKRIQVRSAGRDLEVVGVARTGKYLSLLEAPQPHFYVPFSQSPRTRMTLLVRTEGPPAALTRPVLDTVRSIDPEQAVFNVRDMETYYGQGVLGLARSVLRAVWSLGAAGLLLALAGLYGLVSYSTARRTREIGIRMAAGAGRRAVLWLVLRQGLTLCGLGTLAGLALAVPLFLALSAAAAGAGRLTPWALAVVPLCLLAMAGAACYFPALQAARTDPNRALRLE
jgi:predicted permease